MSLPGSKILKELPERETEGGEGVFKPFTNIVGGLKREEVLLLSS